jgi:hypothetical protein
MLGGECDRGDRKFRVVEDTWLGVAGMAVPDWTLTAGFFFIFTAGLGAVVGLDSGFVGLAIFLVAVSLGCLGPFVTGYRKGFCFVSEVLVPLTTASRTSCIRSSPRSLSAELLARCVFYLAGWPVSVLFWPCLWSCYAGAALASFHLVQPRYFVFWLTHHRSTG